MMTNKLISKEYFNWMYDLVNSNSSPHESTYYKLFNLLNTMDFKYAIDRDKNRAVDGVNLRYKFGYLFKYTDDMLTPIFKGKPCSVLEMMLALSYRIEESIMYDPELGDRTGLWFWSMIENIGLSEYTDDNFNKRMIKNKVDRLLYRDYSPNGKGGLFYIPDTSYDLRDVEIWYQMNWYLNSVSERR